MDYPINELFYSVQGEATWAGEPAFFIRLQGCPLACKFCDSAGTWHPDWKPRANNIMTVETLVAEVKASGAKMVVITGGEPAMFDLAPLIEGLQRKAQAFVAIETSGAFVIKGYPDWITVSPKRAKEPIAETLLRAHELKLIIENPGDIKYWDNRIAFITDNRCLEVVRYLNPEWSQRNNAFVRKGIIDAVKGRERRYRAGWQLHKNYQADGLDSRTQPVAPLGGRKEGGL